GNRGMTRAPVGRLAACLLAGLVCLAGRATGGQAKIRRAVAVPPDMRLFVLAGDELLLEIPVRKGESLAALAKRVTGDARSKKAIQSATPGLTEPLTAGTRLSVPHRLLLPALQKPALAALFPQDRADAAGWTHLVTAPSGRPESLWRIAEWYTGDGKNYK